MAPEAGGPPVVAAGLAGALAKRGHSLAIASVQFPGQSPMGVDPQIRLHTFPLSGSPRYAKSAPLDAWLNGHVKEFDILHLHSLWQFPTFAAARAAYRNDIPYITVPHGMLDRYSIRQRSAVLKRGYWLYREKNIHARAAAIHCLNQAEIDNAVPWIKPFPKFILANGISQSELDHLPPRGLFRQAHPEIGDRPLALFLSRIHPKKGLDRLIPAWKTLAEKLPNSILAIAGTGDAAYLGQIDQLIAQHGLQKNIVRVGQLVGEKKWQALVDADIFVLPSHQEGFSMAITEALAASCPVIATEECNFPELSTAVISPPSETGSQLVSQPSSPCGIIVKNGDMPAFVNAAFDLFTDAARRAQLAASARALIARRFTWEKIAAQLEQKYRQILADH
jgi:glycosyltransferase involved in cell wall biosynthesis